MTATRVLAIGGRGLLALLFVLAGLAKFVAPQPFIDHMAAVGVPTALLPLVAAFELAAGLVLAIGWRTREAASLLGGFCILTAVIFHHQLGDKAERSSFFKDLAIAGGLFAMAAHAASAPRARRNPGDAA